MKDDVADFVSRIAIKASGELTALIPFLKDHAENDVEYEKYRKALTEAIRAVTEGLIIPLLEEHPTSAEQIDQIIKTFGRLP